MIGHLVVHAPDQHPEIDVADAEAVLFGVPRAATVMAFQLLQGLFPFGGVLYSHAYLAPPPHVWCVGCYRDFRACVVSWWRYQVGAVPGCKMTLSEIRRFAGMMAEMIFAMDQYNGHQRVTWLRYEQHLGDPRTVLSELAEPYAKFTGQPIAPPLWERAGRYLGRKAQAELADTHQSRLMKPRHLADGTSDGWRQWVTPEGTGLLTDLLMKPLQRWGYA